MADAMTMMTISAPTAATPSIERAAEMLGVNAEAMDRGFGVVLIDPSKHLYAVQVRASALPASARARQTAIAARSPIRASTRPGPRR